MNIVRAGERSGEFAETLRRICLLLEANAKLRRKVKSAMTYPLVVLCLALAIAAALVTFVVPVFKKMFEDFGARLPGPTRALVALSDGIRHNIWIIVPVIFAVIYAVRQWARSDAGKWTLHGFYLRMPIFGGLVQKVAMTRFARILALMVRSGVPILDSLEIVAQACGNRVVGAAILQARTVVEQGEPLARGLSDKPCIPLLVTRMVAAGERSGRVDEMLDHIADAYDEEIEATLAALTSMIEPLLMVLLGVIIGSIVIALFMPIFQLGSIVNA
jgi:type IV pilus assembly protein PilC